MLSGSLQRLRDVLLIAGILTAATVNGFTLPPPTGPYFVGLKPYVLEHITPIDPVTPNGTGTSVLVNFYFPTLQQAPLGRYVAHGLAEYYETYYKLPKDTLYNITASVSHNADSLPSETECDIKLPTLVFGPPFAGPPSQVFTALFSDLVSHGYTIITIDHPYEQPFLEYPDGTQIPGLPVDVDFSEADLLKVNDYRITDALAVLDALPAITKELELPGINQTHFVTFGHSVGGSWAFNQILAEKHRSTKRQYLGALDIDGTIWGPANSSSEALGIPSLLFASFHNDDDPTWATFPPKQQPNWTKTIRVLGNTNHTDFSDLILWKQWTGVAGGGEGTIAAARMVDVTRTFVGDFFKLVEGRGEREGVLSGNEEVGRLWPEVVFDYNGTGM